MNRSILFLLLASIMFGFSACGGEDSDLSAPASDEPVSVSPVNAVGKAQEAKDTQEQANEQRGQQIEEELESYGDLP